MGMMFKTRIPGLIGVLMLVTGFVGYGAETTVYATTFGKGGNGAPDGWIKTGAAFWDDIGRSGNNKSIKISSWGENADKSTWSSPLIPLQSRIISLGLWGAENLVYANDPGYCGSVAVVFFDAQKEELSRQQVITISKHEKGSLYEVQRIVPQGLVWEYYEGSITAPTVAKYVRIVFSWPSFAVPWRGMLQNGEVWIDDLTLIAEPETPVRTSAGELKETSLPYRLTVNTPVEINLFMPDDPLEFNVLLWEEGAGQMAWPGDNLKLKYEITDFEKLVVERGEAGFGRPVFNYNWVEEKREFRGLLKTVFLDEKIRRTTGRWLAIEVKLCKGNQVLAQGDTAFAVLEPSCPDTDEEVIASHFLRGTSRGRFRWWDSFLETKGNWGRVRKAPWNMDERPTWSEMAGNNGLTYLGWETAWKELQPEEDKSPDFSKCPPEPVWAHCTSRTYTFEERAPGYKILMYTQAPAKLIPAWAIKGKKDDGTLDVDVTAYSNYVKEVVRHSNATHYLVNSAEGHGIKEYAYLTVAGARAVKEVDSRLKVGVLCDISGGAGAAKELNGLGVLDWADFLVNDYYGMHVDALPLKKELTRLGKPKEIWFQEHCFTGSTDQITRARSVVSYILFAFAHGTDKLFWWSRPIPEYALNPSFEYKFGPGLRDPYSLKSDFMLNAGPRTEGGGPCVSPDLPAGSRAYLPFLEFITQYNLSRLADYSQNMRQADLLPGCTSYLWDSGVCIFTTDFKGPKNVLICGGFGDVEITDLYGRRTWLSACDASVAVTITEDPLFIRFSNPVSNINVKPFPGEVEFDRENMSSGTTKTVRVKISNPFDRQWNGAVEPAVDPTWKIEPCRNDVNLAAGESKVCTFNITIPGDKTAAGYPLFIRLYDGNRVIGLLRETIKVVGPLNMQVDSTPYTLTTQPAIIVTVANHCSVPVRGEISFTNPVTKEMRPQKMVRKFCAAAEKAESVKFELDGIPDLDRAYRYTIRMKNGDGRMMEKSEDLFFLGVNKRCKPIKVDADLSDWDKKKLVPLKFFYEFRTRADRNMSKYRPDDPSNAWRGPQDVSVTMYMCWDEYKLYVGAEVTDDSHENDGEYSGIWAYDCIILLFYPWKVRLGEASKATPYKDHCGLNKRLESTIDRVSAPFASKPPGSTGWLPPDTEFAARRTQTGYVMEWAYSTESLAPLELKAGAEFRMTGAYCDKDIGRLPYQGGIGWFYGFANVESNVNQMGQLQLVD